MFVFEVAFAANLVAFALPGATRGTGKSAGADNERLKATVSSICSSPSIEVVLRNTCAPMRAMATFLNFCG